MRGSLAPDRYVDTAPVGNRTMDGIKGFREFYPEEMAARRRVFDTVESVVRGYGFREIGTPALERTELYVEKSGEEIVEELYAFEDKGGRDIALTPELTPTTARLLADREQALSKPVKWFSTRPFWRYEEPQSGRFREFTQTNVDVFGSSEPAADAEVLACAADALAALGLDANDVEFRVSHRDLLGGLAELVGGDGVDVEAVTRTVDKRDRIEPADYRAGLRDAGLDDAGIERFDEVLDDGLDAARTVAAGRASDSNTTAADAANRILDAADAVETVLDAVADRGAGKFCTVSLDTARGLDYYTGVVFECFDTTGDVSRSIFGGGRYDDLVGDLGGTDVPAVGFAVGDATLEALLRRADLWPAEERTTDYYVLSVGDTAETAARVARDLRDRGHVVETDLMDRGFGAQLEYADGIGAETTVVVGERDLADGNVTVKDMASGDQVAVPVDDFPGERERPIYDDFAD
jgi:histidyl-tRNA synthetase